jgi:hypothetical protein
MASGGKYCFGIPSQMDGEIYPEPGKNVEFFGNWYRTRRSLFREAIPMDYKGEKLPGVELSEQQFGLIGSIYQNDNLIHIINFKGIKTTITLKFSRDQWYNIKKIILEPNEMELKYNVKNNEISLTINSEDIDPVDTIILITKQ